MLSEAEILTHGCHMDVAPEPDMFVMFNWWQWTSFKRAMIRDLHIWLVSFDGADRFYLVTVAQHDSVSYWTEF